VALGRLGFAQFPAVQTVRFEVHEARRAPYTLSKLSTSDLDRLDKVSMSWFDSGLAGYLRLQTTRPMTVCYGLCDSPVGLLAWIAEKFCEWNKSAKTPDDVIDRDRLLTNVSIYWFTGTMASAIQMHYESGRALGALFAPGMPNEPVQVPIGVAFFQQDPAPPFCTFADLDSSTIMHWSTFERGGHHGPSEEPQRFATDITAFARALPR
jgi:epoxide hydrolase